MTILHLPVFTSLVALCTGLSAGSALAAPATARQMPSEIVAPLLADDGSAYPGAAPSAPSEPAVQAAVPGAAPVWATPAQCQQLEHIHPKRVVHLRAGDRSTPAQPTPARDAWVFVEGPAADAVQLARRLTDAGVERVWVLLPERAAGRSQP